VDDHAFKFQGTGYDRIIMNPPFDGMEDIDHVIAAWDRLKEGGEMVALMSGGSADDPKFRSWVNSCLAGEINLPASAFNSKETFRRTVVRTRVLRLLKGERQ
jgi:hypothetical protein